MEFGTGLADSTPEEFKANWENIFANIKKNITTAADGAPPVQVPIRLLLSFEDLAVELIGDKIKESIQPTIDRVIASIVVMASRIVARIVSIANTIRGQITKFINIGRAIVTGLQLGIQLAWVSFTAWLTAKINELVESVLAALGISSPSKVFANIGKNMMAGMAVGIQGGMQMPIAALQQAIPQMAYAAAGGGMSQQHNYYYGNRFMLERGAENQILTTLTV